jgi:subtilisin family serine protease
MSSFVTRSPAWWIALLVLSLIASPAQHDLTKSAEPNAAQEFLVRFKGAYSTSDEVARFMARQDLMLLQHLPQIDVWLVTPRDTFPAQNLASLMRQSEIDWVESNDVLQASGVITPSDEFYLPQQLPYLSLMRLPEAWTYTTGDALIIAIVDTGVDLNHPDLANKLWTNPDESIGNGVDDDLNGYVDDGGGWNFVSNSNLVQDNNGHGSHVAGSAAAHTNNGLGIAGVSWNSIIMPVKALNSLGQGTYADIAAAIIYAADEGASVINLSLGGPVPPQTVRLAVSYAQSKGCLVIASTGNSGVAGVEYPAALPGVLAVAATTNQDEWWFDSSSNHGSNYGPEVDVAAPGVDIFSTVTSGGYFVASGTSMSTAHVSGLAALIWSANPAYSADGVARVITATAHDVASGGWDQYTGWGRIDAYAALQEAVAQQLFLPLVMRQ